MTAAEFDALLLVAAILALLVVGLIILTLNDHWRRLDAALKVLLPEADDRAERLAAKREGLR